MLKKIETKTGDVNYTFSLAQISHEIRNPLTLIYSTAQLLAHKHPELGEDELWSQLIKDIDYLKDLTASLSAYNHSGELKLVKTDMNLLLKEISAAYKSEAVSTEKSLTLNILSALPPVYCDATKIKQCLINLIKNALEATKAGDRIEISATANRHTLLISIHDSGPGIPKENLSHIFEPFTTYKSGGSGLGLAITQKIIESHHGRIRVYSKIGNGTRFIIRLPLVQP